MTSKAKEASLDRYKIKLGKHSQLVETRSNKSSVILKTSSARRVIYLKVKALKEEEEQQARLEKLKREALQREIADLHQKLVREAGRAEIENEIAEASSSQGTSFRNISPVDSFTEDSGRMEKSEIVENGAKSKIAVSIHSTPENAVNLIHEGIFSGPRRHSKTPTEADERADRKDRTNYDNGSCRQGATSQPEVKVANKGTSKSPHSGMHTKLVRNNRFGKLSALLPFRNPPRGYQTKFGRRDSLCHE